MAQTEAGMILGTASYMAPEQAKGKPVDKRADIYAFGVVLYEMLAGKRLHRGETTTEVLASVLKEEPKWEKIPPQVRRLLQRCLEKDPQKRLRHIGDAMELVDDAMHAPAVTSRAGRQWPWPAVAGALTIALAAVELVAYSEPHRSSAGAPGCGFGFGHFPACYAPLRE
jgi:serine/threonine-protein kinase